MSDIFIGYLLSFVVLFVVVKRRAWPTVSAVFARAESDWPRALSSVPGTGLCRGAAHTGTAETRWPQRGKAATEFVDARWYDEHDEDGGWSVEVGDG
jgi:hypothetical protein